jgi:hypothetical protein
MRVASTINSEARLSCIRLYAIVLLLLSLIGAEVFYVPVGEFKLSAYKFFLLLFPVAFFFIPYRTFVNNIRSNGIYIYGYFLLVFLPHIFFIAFWGGNIADFENLIFFISALLITLLLSGTASSEKEFLHVFNIVEIGICILGLICFIQYCINSILFPFLAVDIFKQNAYHLLAFGGPETMLSIRSDLKADIFLIVSIFFTFSGYILQQKRIHLIFTTLFLVLYFIMS